MPEYIPRADFLRDYFEYHPGEHVSLIEPTQGGKSKFIGQLLEVALAQNPGIRTAVLVPKPADPATREFSERLGLKILPTWPPRKRYWTREPPGYVLWPKHIKSDPQANREYLASELRKCVNEQYWQGNSLTIADDVFIAAVILDLNMDFEQIWTAGGAMGSGLWSANQKPSGTIGTGSVSSFSYNSPTHLILGRDPDERNRKRFAEIGGVDPRLVSSIVASLQVHQIETPQGTKNISDKLYIHKGGPYMAIIGP